jgi:hypothetical protein
MFGVTIVRARTGFRSMLIALWIGSNSSRSTRRTDKICGLSSEIPKEERVTLLTIRDLALLDYSRAMATNERLGPNGLTRVDEESVTG